MEIAVSGRNKRLVKLVENLAKELGLSTKRIDIGENQKMSQEERSEKLYQLMEEMAASGGIESIKDPIAWQNEVREDKKLYGRE